jgi:uncharacterized protein (TIGR00270 family)
MKGRGRNVVIEGAAMLVCPQCAARFGGQPSDSGQRAKSRFPKQRPAWATGSTERITTSSPRVQSKRAIGKDKPRRKSKRVLLDDMALIEDYSKVIRTARQKLKMNQEELAQRVGERVSTMQAIEAGRLKPTRKTIRGLERELEISLLEPIQTSPVKTRHDESDHQMPTLGDRVIVKRKVSQKHREAQDENN